MRFRPIRFLLKFGLFIICLLLLIGFVSWMAMAIGVDDMSSFQNAINNIWLKASVVRWIILAVIIFFLPRFYIYKRNRHANEKEAWQAEYADAEAHDADWDILQAIRHNINTHEKMELTFHSMNLNKHWIALGLVGIEVLFVQLPHWL